MQPTKASLYVLGILVAAQGLRSPLGGSADPELQVPGWLGLGFCYQENASESLAPEGWLLVQGLAPDSPARQAGFEVGDVIAEINGAGFRYENDFLMLDFFAKIRPGDQVTFTVFRGTAKKTLKVTAAQMPQQFLEGWRRSYLEAKKMAEPTPNR